MTPMRLSGLREEQNQEPFGFSARTFQPRTKRHPERGTAISSRVPCVCFKTFVGLANQVRGQRALDGWRNMGPANQPPMAESAAGKRIKMARIRPRRFI